MLDHLNQLCRQYKALSESVAINVISDQYTDEQPDARVRAAGVSTSLAPPTTTPALSQTLCSLQPSASIWIPLDPSLLGFRSQFPPPYPMVFPWDLTELPSSTLLAISGLLPPSQLKMLTVASAQTVEMAWLNQLLTLFHCFNLMLQRWSLLHSQPVRGILLWRNLVFQSVTMLSKWMSPFPPFKILFLTLDNTTPCPRLSRMTRILSRTSIYLVSSLVSWKSQSSWFEMHQSLNLSGSWNLRS